MNNRTTIVLSIVLVVVLRLCPRNGSKMFPIHETFLKPIVQLLNSPPRMPPDLIESHLVALHIRTGKCMFLSCKDKEGCVEWTMDKSRAKGRQRKQPVHSQISYIP